MGSPPRNDLAASPAADRLTGWKEIASFVGRGVRTVQRWETTLGLPVHRLRHERGEVVFASKSELEDWLQESAGRRALAEGAGAAEPPGAGQGAGDLFESAPAERHAGVGSRPPVPETEIRRRRRWWLRAALVALLVAAVTAVLWRWRHQPPPLLGAQQPATWSVDHDRLTVYDRAGQVLWTRHFDLELGHTLYRHPEDHKATAVVIQDIDGDLDREVVFGLVTGQAEPTSVFVFNRDGTLRFSGATPREPLRFGSTDFSPEWVVGGIETTATQAGVVSIWVRYLHKPYFPSLLLQLDARGNVRSRYVSNGYITSVTQARWRGAQAVLVGAANNETRGASLAVFLGETVHGSAPAEHADYRCVNCPAGAPDSFLVFPRTCLGMGAGQTAHVLDSWVGTDDHVWVEVRHGQLDRPGLPPGGSVLYNLDPTLVPTRAEFLASFASVHAVLQREGTIDHAFGPGDRGATAFPVRAWNGTRFVDLPGVQAQIDR